jgi:UDP-N-acetylmuramoyl-tripeptide--D-alanyl-D-alanine ligase
MIDVEKLYEIYTQYPNIVTDSRKITQDCLYFALKGERFDGNKFGQQAIDLGAKWVILDDSVIASTISNSFIVADVLITLQALAKLHRSKLLCPVLGITGSNGKTTTKELSLTVISKKYNARATFGNLNNHIGVPLSILSTPLSCEFLIIEMGANHQGEISDLCGISDPDYVMITNIGKAHLEGFGGIEGIKLGKSEIYKYAEANNKSIFINIDDEVLTSLIPFEADLLPYRASELVLNDSESEYLRFTFQGRSFETQIYGIYNMENIAFAINLGKHFGVSLNQVHDAICKYKSDNNRSQLHKIESNQYILDSYNANPTSMVASLESFAELDAHNKIAILGDMLELGEYAEVEHSNIVDFAMKLRFQQVIFIGKIFKSVGKTGLFFTTVDDAKVYFDSLDLQNATILLKGSRGIAVEKILV